MKDQGCLINHNFYVRPKLEESQLEDICCLVASRGFSMEGYKDKVGATKLFIELFIDEKKWQKKTILREILAWIPIFAMMESLGCYKIYNTFF